MTAWSERTHEERHLLNPAFCAILLWQAALGASENQRSLRSTLAYIESFLILPLTLHQQTRNSLPNRIDSSLPIWVRDNPLAVDVFPARASSLVSYTKEALIFGISGELYQIDGDQIQVNADKESAIKKMLGGATNEVRQCNQKARFLGKWFTYTGNPETIFTLFGIRP